MGADFIFNWIALNKNEEETKKSLLKAIDSFEIPELRNFPKQQVINALKDKNSQNFEEFCYFWQDGLGKEFNDAGFPIEDGKDLEEDDEELEEKVLTEERAKEIMKRIVEEFFECLNYRDIGSFEFKGSRIYLSGGMSWGDSPSDSSDVIDKMNNLPLKIREAGDVE